MKALPRNAVVVLAAGLAWCMPGLSGVRADIGINLTTGGGSWAMGTQLPGYSTSRSIQVQNNGNCYEDIKIKTFNSANWAAGSSAGDNVFCVKYGSQALTTGDWTISTYLAENTSLPSATLSFDAPTSGTAGVEQTITVRLTAAPIAGYTYNSAADVYYSCLGFGDYSSTDWSGAYDHVLSETWSGSFLSHTYASASSTSYKCAGQNCTYWATYQRSDAAFEYPYQTRTTLTGSIYGYHTQDRCTQVRGLLTGSPGSTVWLDVYCTNCMIQPNFTDYQYISSFYPRFVVLD